MTLIEEKVKTMPAVLLESRAAGATDVYRAIGALRSKDIKTILSFPLGAGKRELLPWVSFDK